MNTRISNAEPTELLCPHCGQSHLATYTHCPNTGKALNVGRAMIGRVIADCYRVVGLLGEGGMGAVYVADHLRIGRKVAIKRLHPELAADQKAVQRFQREARAAAATGHEHIVEIIDLGYTEDGAPYLVMEYLRGVTLAQLLKIEGRLPAKRACHIVGQLLAALAAVHEKDIVHRDLKPDNIFLTRRGADADYVKVLDFGISKMKSEDDGLELTRTGVMMGTPYYMSPEQARGMKSLDHRVDIYAAGVILFECLTGRVPFAGDNYHALLQQILRVPPQRASEVTPGIPRDLDDVIARALSKEAVSRFPNAATMLEALLPHGAVRPIPRSDDSPPRFSESDPTTSDVRLRVDGFASTEAIDPSRIDPTRYDSPAVEGSRPHALRSAIETPDLVREPTAPRARLPVPSAAPRIEPRTPARTTATPVRSDAPRADIAPPSAEPITRARPVPAAASAPSGAAASVASPPAVSEGRGRYFFVASDDWNRDAVRTVMPLGLRVGPQSLAPRDPGGAGAPGVGSMSVRDGGSRERTAGGREATQPFAHHATTTPRDAAPAAIIVRDSVHPAPDETTRRATADATVKGTVVSGALLHLENVHGIAKVDAVLARIEPLLRAKLSGVILPMAWLPLAALEQLLRVADETLGGDGATAEAIGRACADRELPSTHRLFMQSATPTSAVERMPLLHRAYFGRGEAKVASSGPTGARLVFDHLASDSFVVTFLVGFTHRLLELSGARDVRVSRGEDRGSLVLRWR